MNYPSLQVEAYLFWGFEYFSVLNLWQEAHAKYTEAEKLIKLQPDSYIEERARLFIGLGQVALAQNNLIVAKDFLEKADSLIDEKNLIWWRPIADYFLGIWSLLQNDDHIAKSYFLAGLNASENGCPDFKPMCYLELAKCEGRGAKQVEYLKSCIDSARKHSRFADKNDCLKGAGTMLLAYEQPELKKLGEEILSEVADI